ncbi:CNKSR3 [Branchiostoma lanceolatum]|uniref:CNKSR3 protein n=1 Tax=Branchiostoma lanceolatum TaxID=7740 RepID=A0A8J9VT18_BRALA|nr:CNKSR3 [Branchiostoma lanceolatum]
MCLYNNKSNMANSMESVGIWTPKQVGLWLKGLDDAVQPYIQSFILAGVTGDQLLNLSHRDMDRLNITKLGHQELILEAVDLLCALNFGLENETLQSLTVALGLNVENLDMAMTVRNQQSILVGLAGPRDNYKLPPDILRAICDVLSAAKAVVSWLDRTPFVQMMNYIAIRNRIVRICLGFTSSIHKDPNKRDAEETVVPLCKELAMLSQSLQQSVKDDPQVCHPARVEVVTLTNVDHKLGLGMFIQSSFNGTHYVTGTKEGSPAHTCKRIHPGDEILQVNYQTVVGWKLKKLVDALKEDPHGVVVTFKKRPKTSRSSGTPSRPSSGSSSRVSQSSRHSSGNHIRGRSLDSASPANSVGRVPPSPLVELYLPPPPPEPYKPRQVFFDRVRAPNITQSQVQVHQPLWEDEDMSPPPPQPLSDRSQSVHIPSYRHEQEATWHDDERSPPSSRPLSGRSQSAHFPGHGQRAYWDGDEEGFSPTDAPPFNSRAQSFNQPSGQQWELTQRDFSQPQPPVAMSEQSMYSTPPQSQWIPFPANVPHDMENSAQASNYQSVDVQHREEVVQRSPVSFPRPARSHSLHVPIYGPQGEEEEEVPPEEPVPAYMPRGGHRRSKREDTRPLVSSKPSGRDSRRSSQRHSRSTRPTNMQMRSFSPEREEDRFLLVSAEVLPVPDEPPAEISPPLAMEARAENVSPSREEPGPSKPSPLLSHGRRGHMEEERELGSNNMPEMQMRQDPVPGKSSPLLSHGRSKREERKVDLIPGNMSEMQMIQDPVPARSSPLLSHGRWRHLEKESEHSPGNIRMRQEPVPGKSSPLLAHGRPRHLEKESKHSQGNMQMRKDPVPVKSSLSLSHGKQRHLQKESERSPASRPKVLMMREHGSDNMPETVQKPVAGKSSPLLPQGRPRHLEKERDCSPDNMPEKMMMRQEPAPSKSSPLLSVGKPKCLEKQTERSRHNMPEIKMMKQEPAEREEGESLSPTRPLPLGARSPNYLLDRQSKYRRSATFSEGTENHDPSFRLAQETRETLREVMLRARQNRRDGPRERPKSLPPDTGMQGFRTGSEREQGREGSNHRLSDQVRMEVETISEASTSAESSPQRSVPPRPSSQPDAAPHYSSTDREVIVINKQDAVKDFVPSNLRKLTGDMSSMPAFRVERETRSRGKNASRGPPPPYEHSRMDGRHSFKSVPEVSKLPMDEVARRTRPLTDQFSAKLAIFEGGSESNVMKRPPRKHFAERVSELQEVVKSPAKEESIEEESNFQRGVVGKGETNDSTIRTTRYVHRISLRFKKDKDKSESAGANPEGVSPQAADSEPANVLPVSVQPSKQSFGKESSEGAYLDDFQNRFAPAQIIPPLNQERLVREKTKKFTRRMDPVESVGIVEQEPSYSSNKEVKYDTPPMPVQRDSVRESRTNTTVQKQEVSPKSPTSAAGSYSVTIVGGVPVRIGSTSHVQQNMPPPDQSVRMRSKNKVTGTQKYSRRRMSCKDLGNGDCQGWLWKKKEQKKFFAPKWKKLWFVLKKFSLYYYADPHALKAEGIINLPEYSIVYATDTECGRKFGIKASHTEIKTFFFATESKEDRDRWLNKLQLASIQYDRQSIHDESLNILELAKQCPAIVEGFGYYSESDEESEPPSPGPLSPTSPPRKRKPTVGEDKEDSPERPVFDDSPIVSPPTSAPVRSSMKRDREQTRKHSYLAAVDAVNGTKKSPPPERRPTYDPPRTMYDPPRPTYDPPRPTHDPPRPPSNPPVEHWGQSSTTSSDSECTHVTPMSSTSSSSSTASSPMLVVPPPPQFGSTDELKNLYRQSWNVIQEEKMIKMLEFGQAKLSEKQEKELKLQKLTRVLKDKEGNLEAIDRLLTSPQLTSKEVQDWKDQNQHILEDVVKHKPEAEPPQKSQSRPSSQSGPVPKPRTSIHRNSQGPIEEMTQRLSITKRPISTDLDRIENDAGINLPLPEIDDDEDDSYSSTSL